MKHNVSRLVAALIGALVTGLLSPLAMTSASATPVSTPSNVIVTQDADGAATISWSGQATAHSNVPTETGTALYICGMNEQSCTSSDNVVAFVFFAGEETAVTLSRDTSTVTTQPSGALLLQDNNGLASLPVGYYTAQLSQWNGGVEASVDFFRFTIGGQVVVSDTTPTTSEPLTITVSHLPAFETFTMTYLPFFQNMTIGIPIGLGVIATFTTDNSGAYTWSGDWLADFELPSSYAGILPGILMVTPEQVNTTYDFQLARSVQIFPGKGYGTAGTSFEFSGPGFVNGQLVPGQDVVVVAKGFPVGTEIVGIVAFDIPNPSGDLDTDFWTWYYSNWSNNGNELGNGTWWDLAPDVNDPSVLTDLITIPVNFTADTKVWTWHVSGLAGSTGPEAIARYGYGVVPLATFLEDVIEVPVAPVAPVWVDPVLPLSDPVIAGQKYAGGSVTCTSPAFDPVASSIEFTWTLNGQLLKSESVSKAPFVSSLVLASDVKEGSMLDCRVTARTSIGTGTVVTETPVVAKPAPTSPVTSTCGITNAAKISASFAQGSSTLSTSAVKAVRAKSGRACSGTYLVSGHVSGKSTAANRRLANSRAQALVKALQSQHPNATFTVVNASAVSKALCPASAKGRCASVRIQQ